MGKAPGRSGAAVPQLLGQGRFCALSLDKQRWEWNRFQSETPVQAASLLQT